MAKWQLVSLMPKKPKNRGGRPKANIDGALVRQLAMIGCTTEVIAQHFHVCRDTIENRFRYELDEGRSDTHIRVRGKLFQSAMNGSQRALEVCAVSLCGMSLNKPETVVNVVQHAAVVDPRSPEEIKAHLVEMQRAIWAEAKRQEFEPLPAP